MFSFVRPPPSRSRSFFESSRPRAWPAFFLATSVTSALIAVLSLYRLLSGAQHPTSLVTQDAQRYLDSLYDPAPRFSCASIDTDANGYVSCTAVLDSGVPFAFECSPFLAQCRLAGPRFFSPLP